MTFRMLNYRELAEAYAFIRDAEGDGPVLSDHPDFYGASHYGVHRAPLPTLVDRGHLRFDEAEDALIDSIDNADPGPTFDPFEDDPSPFRDAKPDDALWMSDMTDMMDEDMAITLATARFYREPPNEPVVPTVSDVAGPDIPCVIGSRRAAIMTLTGDKQEGHPRRKVICWKEGRNHVRHQFERHA